MVKIMSRLFQFLCLCQHLVECQYVTLHLCGYTISHMRYYAIVALTSVLMLYVSAILYIRLFDSRHYFTPMPVLMFYVLAILCIAQFDHRSHFAFMSGLCFMSVPNYVLYYLTLEVKLHLSKCLCLTSPLHCILSEGSLGCFPGKLI